MLQHLHSHGFRTLVHTSVDFNPFTILIGKNGVGKTTLLDVVQLVGKFARGGPERAFGPPPWSLGWQRTKGIGTVNTVDFELKVSTPDGRKYRYDLKLGEENLKAKVKEERLTRETDNKPIANYDFRNPPLSGSILHPPKDAPFHDEIAAVADVFKSFESYELNPTAIEQGIDPKQTYVRRDGYGVAGYLAYLKDEEPDKFDALEQRLKVFRPETESINVWAPAEQMYWGLLDKGHDHTFPSVHLSWGDRQLVGLLCVLFAAKPGATIAIEEIDRGFHPSRYEAVIRLLSEAVHTGLFGGGRIQVIITTHSPSFLNLLGDMVDNIRLVTSQHGTRVARLADVVKEKLGPDALDIPLGEIWQMELLEDTIRESLT